MTALYLTDNGVDIISNARNRGVEVFNIKVADEIWVLPEWESSEEPLVEIAKARQLRKPIKFIKSIDPLRLSFCH